MKLITLALALITFPAFACHLSIPESYVPTFLAPPVSGHYLKCEDFPEDKCLCVEAVDPWTSDYLDGAFSHNSDKAFALELKERNKKEVLEQIHLNKKAAKERIKSLDLSKTMTTKQITDALKDVQEALRE